MKRFHWSGVKKKKQTRIEKNFFGNFSRALFSFLLFSSLHLPVHRIVVQCFYNNHNQKQRRLIHENISSKKYKKNNSQRWFYSGVLVKQRENEKEEIYYSKRRIMFMFISTLFSSVVENKNTSYFLFHQSEYLRMCIALNHGL